MSFPRTKLNKNVHAALWMNMPDCHILVQAEEGDTTWLVRQSRMHSTLLRAL